MQALAKVAAAIDWTNERIGRSVAWLAIIMVLVQFIVVLMRYVFGMGSIMMQESITYMHAILFMTGAGYTLLHNGHVRVDIFYRDASEQAKAAIDLVGSLVLLLPVCGLILLSSYPYVLQSWATREGSVETSGIPGIFLLKTVILVFCAVLGLQGISLIIKSALTLLGKRPSPIEEGPAYHG